MYNVKICLTSIDDMTHRYCMSSLVLQSAPVYSLYWLTYIFYKCLEWDEMGLIDICIIFFKAKTHPFLFSIYSYRLMAVPSTVVYFTSYDQLKVRFGLVEGETHIVAPMMAGMISRGRYIVKYFRVCHMSFMVIVLVTKVPQVFLLCLALDISTFILPQAV